LRAFRLISPPALGEGLRRFSLNSMKNFLLKKALSFLANIRHGSSSKNVISNIISTDNHLFFIHFYQKRNNLMHS
ncbi:hypothetical protein, partial [Proteus vulgaris]|uniref:hypothetical protein n=1 Tax=Proteus vulgaris TaxID=585 RepID=UPI0034D6F82F